MFIYWRLSPANNTPSQLKYLPCRVPAAKDGRDSPEWDIFGMAGVPPGMKPGDPVPKGSKQNGAAQAVEAVPDATATIRSAAPVAPAAPGPAAQYGMPPYGAPQ